LSISSSIEARTVPRIATTASAAAVIDGKLPTSVAFDGCSGISRRIARVMIPRVPSLPTKSLSSESPATSLICRPPRVTSVPSASTTSMPST